MNLTREGRLSSQDPRINSFLNFFFHPGTKLISALMQTGAIQEKAIEQIKAIHHKGYGSRSQIHLQCLNNPPFACYDLHLR